MATTRVNFRLSEELVARADLAAAVLGKNRTEVVTEALVSYLEALEGDDRYKESLVEAYLDDEVDLDALREAVGRQDSEAIRASKELLDGGDELANELAGGDPESG